MARNPLAQVLADKVSLATLWEVRGMFSESEWSRVMVVDVPFDEGEFPVPVWAIDEAILILSGTA